MSGMTWLTTDEVAPKARCSPRTVNRAATDGRLHSHQGVARGKRVVAEPVVDIWIQGGTEAAQREACGCLRVVARRSA